MQVADALAYYYLRNPLPFDMPTPKPLIPPPWKAEILASDINYSVLRTAQEGVYSEGHMEAVDYAYRLRYFDKVGDRYAVKKSLKELVQFDFHNLKTEFLPQRNDVIFCRNVMIYFDEAEQKRLIEKFYRCLNPEGFLFVGHAESLFGLTDKFRIIHVNNGTAYQRIDVGEPCGASFAAQQPEAVHPSAGEAREAEPAYPAKPASRPSPAADNILRVDAERIDGVLNLVGELVIGKSMLHESVNEFERRFPNDPLRVKLGDALAFQARVLNDLQKSVMRVRMVPVEQLFRRFPRLVRDVARARGKQVEMVVSGQETELDKSILDTLAEPLAHLVRNAVDHGLESTEVRAAAGKQAQGMVRLHAYHQGNQIVIEVADDGRGIDREGLLAKAVAKGVIGADEAQRLTEAECLNLIFHPGLSTADEVTEISGRGVGMDVVKNVVERLKGTVSIVTTPGQGTRFQLRVPLTVAIIQALLFRVAGRTYAVPLSSVVEITRARQADIHRVDEHEVMQLRDQVLTMVRLERLAGGTPSRPGKFFVIVVAIADRKFGLMVERLVREEELVIKALDDHEIAGEAGDGVAAIAEYERTQPDIVLMDITMPQMEGIEATERIIRQHPGARIVMVSSVGYQENVVAALQKGARHFVQKPVKPEVLYEVLKYVLGEAARPTEVTA